MPYKDITGQRFGRYTVIRYVGNDKRGWALWECKCDCGTVKTVLGTSLRKGQTVSSRAEQRMGEERYPARDLSLVRFGDVARCAAQDGFRPS